VYEPAGTFVTVYDPSDAAAAPMFVPTKTTLAPGRASPVAASVTVPDTVCWAITNTGRRTNVRTCENFLMSLSLILFYNCFEKF
jgi:hypothetical protein